jgi:hypothetical protein
VSRSGRAIANAALAAFVACAEPQTASAAPPPRGAQVPQNYVAVERLIVPVIHDHTLDGHLILLVLLEVPQDENRKIVRERMAVLRDALYYDLYNYAARHRDILYNVELPQIKALFLRTAERVVGPGRVEAVLVQAEARRRF